MKVANSYIFDVKPYVPGKPIEEVKRELKLKSVIKLASNENPYPPSPKVLAALAKSAKDINRYPDGGCFALRGVLAKHLKVKAEQLIFGNGSDEIIVLAVKAFVGQGDEVVMAKPSFLVYSIASRLVGAKIHEVPLKNFRYDLEGMKAKLNKKTKIVFIGNPDNPAGTYINVKETESFMKAVSQDTLVFFDEAYFEFVQAKDYPDTLALMKKYPNIITTRTFSKIYALAGLRIGYGIAQPEIVDILNRLREPFNINSMAQTAALAALSDQKYYRGIIQETQEQRQYFYDCLGSMGLKYEVSFTNFILIRVNNASQTSAALLKKGVIVRDMTVWGLSDYIRVSIGTVSENRRFIKALREVL